MSHESCAGLLGALWWWGETGCSRACGAFTGVQEVWPEQSLGGISCIQGGQRCTQTRGWGQTCKITAFYFDVGEYLTHTFLLPYLCKYEPCVDLYLSLSFRDLSSIWIKSEFWNNCWASSLTFSQHGSCDVAPPPLSPMMLRYTYLYLTQTKVQWEAKYPFRHAVTFQKLHRIRNTLLPEIWKHAGYRHLFRHTHSCLKENLK